MLDLAKWAVVNNYKVAWGNIKHLNDANREFEIRYLSNELNELQRTIFKRWSFNKATAKDMKTVIVIAASSSRKTRKLILNCNGIKIVALMPPFYNDDKVETDFDGDIDSKLTVFLRNHGYKVNRLSGPLKNVSARLGLGKYGRNNLLYVEGLGSYTRLLGFVTDAKLTPSLFPGNNDGVMIMESCKKCNLCKINCPTNAIGNDRFQLHVDNCLAYANEKADEWPVFVQNVRQQYLVGCLNCQHVCPHNKSFIDIGSTTSEQFNKDETDFILGQNRYTSIELQKSVYEKFNKMGLSRYKEYILRNIQNYIKNYSGGKLDSKPLRY